MNKLYFLLLCLCFAVNLHAQKFISNPFVINSDTAVFETLDTNQWQILEDTIGKWNIEQVSSSPVSNYFHHNDKDVSNLSECVNTYWIRFTIKNNLPHDVTINLQQKSAFADFYVSEDSNKWNHRSTGYNKPWSKRDGYKLILAVPVEIKKGEEIAVYERIVFDYRISRPKPIEAGFGFDGRMVQKNYVENDSFFFKTILGSFFIGLLFFAAIFNFFFFLIVHERVYFYYALCLLFGSINEYHTIFFHVFFRDYPLLINTNEVFFLILVNFFAIQMERYFLLTFSHYPRWDKILQLSIFIQLLTGMILYFIGPHLSNNADTIIWKMWDWAQGIVLMCILTTFLLYIRKRDRSARQFIIACLPVATVWLVNYLIMNGSDDHIATEWSKYYDRLELLCISSLVIILSWILFDRYNNLRKENAERALLNERLAKEKEIERSQLIAGQKIMLEKEVAARTAELKQSLEDLKAAEKQLIQSEKMASLGELTAGIAHEIQNPLNFVNNFSDVNTELIEELKSELLADNKEEAFSIADDIKENELKINNHGKRADAIVKGMLEHSRAGTGLKELTDINALCDEYLRLSYHGLRAKDKSFNADFTTDFDESIGKINVVPQDMGRVLLNLFNNAFYAVNEKKKQLNEAFKPVVSVSTKRTGNKVEICVRDNGSGVPQKVVDKIFQPFFTTKPTGQGTGLGLSLSYDIIKAHGGKLKVETKENEFALFVIELTV